MYAHYFSTLCQLWCKVFPNVSANKTNRKQLQMIVTHAHKIFFTYTNYWRHFGSFLWFHKLVIRVFFSSLYLYPWVCVFFESRTYWFQDLVLLSLKTLHSHSNTPGLCLDFLRPCFSSSPRAQSASVHKWNKCSQIFLFCSLIFFFFSKISLCSKSFKNSPTNRMTDVVLTSGIVPPSLWVCLCESHTVSNLTPALHSAHQLPVGVL